ncbi:hypothetical protein DFH07DRAFT_986169 [Mycena maculata]|uniref:Uncharacterized protein n=1 Tax=Mycena maculata TaxID=230809 RepID=A0AAD7I6R4_9AGAR|nr:hypothetical protein DFH07DRAFT_986169 [Mycena maculata]
MADRCWGPFQPLDAAQPHVYTWRKRHSRAVLPGTRKVRQGAPHHRVPAGECTVDVEAHQLVKKGKKTQQEVDSMIQLVNGVQYALLTRGLKPGMSVPDIGSVLPGDARVHISLATELTLVREDNWDGRTRAEDKNCSSTAYLKDRRPGLPGFSGSGIPTYISPPNVGRASISLDHDLNVLESPNKMPKSRKIQLLPKSFIRAPPTPSDGWGYIYAFLIRSKHHPTALKCGRTNNPARRIQEWARKCPGQDQEWDNFWEVPYAGKLVAWSVARANNAMCAMWRSASREIRLATEGIGLAEEEVQTARKAIKTSIITAVIWGMLYAIASIVGEMASPSPNAGVFRLRVLNGCTPRATHGATPANSRCVTRAPLAALGGYP